MCYAKPGPRCTSHTLSELKAAKTAYQSDPTSVNFQVFERASREYDASPGGITKLKKEIDSITKPRQIPDRRTTKGYREVYVPLTDAQQLQLPSLHDRLIAGQEKRADAKDAMKNSIAATHASQVGDTPPVVVPKTKLQDPTSGSFGYYGVDVEYDDYSCRHCNGGYEYDEYDSSSCGYGVCRGSEYKNLRIEGVESVRNVLAGVFGTSERNIPENLVTYGEEIGLGDKENYSVDSSAGYYGEEYEVSLDSEKIGQLNSWYLSQPNAEDKQGVLSYVRSKGQVTKDTTPVNAIKSQLLSEKKRLPKVVQEARNVSQQQISLKDITGVRTRAASDPVAYGTSQSIVGVVLRKNDGTYALIDGHKRMASLKGSKRKGNFLVLS